MTVFREYLRDSVGWRANLLACAMRDAGKWPAFGVSWSPNGVHPPHLARLPDGPAGRKVWSEVQAKLLSLPDPIVAVLLMEAPEPTTLRHLPLEAGTCLLLVLEHIDGAAMWVRRGNIERRITVPGDLTGYGDGARLTHPLGGWVRENRRVH